VRSFWYDEATGEISLLVSLGTATLVIGACIVFYASRHRSQTGTLALLGGWLFIAGIAAVVVTFPLT
jgi:hypothetical protein